MKNIFLFFVFLLCMGCDKDREPISAGVETPLNGKVFDYSNELPLVNQKVVVEEYIKTHSFGAVAPNYDFKGRIDSTYTDNNGYFDFRFTTTGNGNFYRVVFEPTQDVQNNSDTFDIDKKDLGIPYQHNFSGIQLYPLTLKIMPKDLNALPVKVSTDFPSKPFWLDNINENNVEVTRHMYVDKNSKVSLQFIMILPPYDEKYYFVEFPAFGTTTPAEQYIELDNIDFID